MKPMHLQALALCAALCGAVQPATADAWVPTAGPPGGFSTAVTVEGDAVYVGTQTAGVFRSVDGVTWTPFSAGLPPHTPVTALLGAGDALLAGTRGAGLYRSTGGDWVAVGPGAPAPYVIHLFADGGRMYATAGDGPSIIGNAFVSEDGGASWSPIATPHPVLTIHADGDLVLAGSGLAFGVLRSTDGGASWTVINAGLPFGFLAPLAALDGQYFIGSNQGLFRSIDLGLTWSPVVGLGSVGVEELAVVDGVIVVTTASGSLLYSSDGGATWLSGGDGLPDETLSLQDLAPYDKGLLAATRTGVYRTPDPAAAWSAWNDGLVTTTVTDLVGTATELFALTAMARGVWHSADAGQSWSLSDEGLPAITPESLLVVDDSTLLLGTHGQGVYRSLNGGLSWQAGSAGLPQYIGMAGVQYQEVPCFARIGDTIYIGTGGGTQQIGDEHSGGFVLSGAGVWRSTNLGASWQPARSGLPIVAHDVFGEPIYATVRALGEADGTLLVGTTLRGVFRSTNGGASWSEANQGLPQSPGGSYPAITAFRASAGVILAVSGVGSSVLEGVVFRSLDGGASWQPGSAGLPVDRAGLDLLVDGDRLIVALAQASGDPQQPALYESTDGAASWQPLAPNLLGVQVNALTASAGTIFAGFGGAGVWQLIGDQPGDVDGDGDVDVSDLGALLAAFQTCQGDPAFDARADFNSDGCVDLTDLGTLLAHYGA